MAKCKKGSKVHIAVDTLGHLLLLHVTPASEQDRAQVAQLARQVQAATGPAVTVAFVDQGYTGQQAERDAKQHGIVLRVIKLPEAKRDFVLLPRRWGVERSFGWAARSRRLARSDERLPETLAGLHLKPAGQLALDESQSCSFREREAQDLLIRVTNCPGSHAIPYRTALHPGFRF